jgi:hypothetical protein
MRRFTVRVELHGAEADREAYPKLHSEMAKEKFLRYLSLTNGRKMQLPEAEYSFTGKGGIKSILQRAKTAASTTGYESSVLVTEVASRIYDNLKEI